MRLPWLLGLALGIWACTRLDEPPAAVEAGRTPIVFVHGSGLSAASWREMRARLEELGYPPDYLLAVDIPRMLAANEATAREVIAPAVEEVLARAARLAARRRAAAPAKVDLIAHSMGAFSSRYYAAIVRPDRVRLWIGLAGANHGTAALCGSPSPGDGEMCPSFASTPAESPLQAALNGTPEAPRDESPYGIGEEEGAERVPPTPERCIAYFTVRIEPDEWIEPAASALLSGAGGLPIDSAGIAVREHPPGNFVLTVRTRHDDLPRHPHAIELVRRMLAAGDAELRRRCPGAPG